MRFIGSLLRDYLVANEILVAAIGDRVDLVGRLGVVHLMVQFGRFEHRQQLPLRYQRALVHQHRLHIAGNLRVDRAFEITVHLARQRQRPLLVGMRQRHHDDDRTLLLLLLERAGLMANPDVAREHQAAQCDQHDDDCDDPSGKEQRSRFDRRRFRILIRHTSILLRLLDQLATSASRSRLPIRLPVKSE